MALENEDPGFAGKACPEGRTMQVFTEEEIQAMADVDWTPEDFARAIQVSVDRQRKGGEGNHDQ